MSNTVGQLKLAIAGFLQRDPSVFVRTGTEEVDLLLRACNNARLYAERKVDFELSKVDAQLSIASITDGADLSGAVLYGTATAVSVKKIITPYLVMENGTQYPVDLWSRKKWDDRVKRKYEGAKPTDNFDYAGLTEAPFVVIRDGNKVFVTPADTESFPTIFTLYMNIVKWLDEYDEDADNDFLLDYCFDWLMYRAIFELNFYLKEDERVNLSSALVADAWDSLVKWNNELMAATVDDVDLD